MIVECTKLCILSSLRQAYHCLWHYKLQHIMIAITAVLPFCLAGFLGLLAPVFSVSSPLKIMPDGFNLSFSILVLTTIIWAFPVTILWHRLYLLGPEHLIRRRIWPLITRSFTIISHSLILFGLGLMAAIATIWSIIYLRMITDSRQMVGTITEMGRLEYALYSLGIILVISFLLLIALRFSMAFASQAIGKSMRLTTSWRITRQNTFRMLVATCLGALPLLGLQVITLGAAKYYLQIDIFSGSAPEPYMIYLFVLIFSPILTSPLAILCSLSSTFYRHCGCAEFRESKG